MDSARGKGTGCERTQSARSEHLNARSVTPARDKNPQTPAFHHEPGGGMSAKASHCSNPTVILVRSVFSSSTVCNTTARWIVRFSDLVVTLPERRRSKAISNLSAGVWIINLSFRVSCFNLHGPFCIRMEHLNCLRFRPVNSVTVPLHTIMRISHPPTPNSFYREPIYHAETFGEYFVAAWSKNALFSWRSRRKG